MLRPSAEVNEVVGGVLARAVQQSAGSVRLHAFTFVSNHFHLVVWARGAALAAFMPKRWSKRGSEEMAGVQGRFAQKWAEPVELEVAPLPCWKGLGEEERQRVVRRLVEEVEAEARTRDKQAAARWRRGDFSVPFPLFSFPPRVAPGLVARVL